MAATLQGAAYTTGTPSYSNLPEPTALKVSEELIWSSNAGRNTDSGSMSGDIKARKFTVDVTWSMLTASQQQTIHNWIDGSSNNRVTAFLKFPYHGSTKQIRCYRGAVSKELLPADKSICKTMTISFIEW